MSLPDEDVEFLDRYVANQGLDSRSAAVQQAIRLLRASGPGAATEQSRSESQAADDEVWDAAAYSDGFD